MGEVRYGDCKTTCFKVLSSKNTMKNHIKPVADPFRLEKMREKWQTDQT